MRPSSFSDAGRCGAGIFSPLLDIFPHIGHLWPFLAALGQFGHSWPILASCGRFCPFWPFLGIFSHVWHFEQRFAPFWRLLYLLCLWPSKKSFLTIFWPFLATFDCIGYLWLPLVVFDSKMARIGQRQLKEAKGNQKRPKSPSAVQKQPRVPQQQKMDKMANSVMGQKYSKAPLRTSKLMHGDGGRCGAKKGR